VPLLVIAKSSGRVHRPDTTSDHARRHEAPPRRHFATIDTTTDDSTFRVVEEASTHEQQVEGTGRSEDTICAESNLSHHLSLKYEFVVFISFTFLILFLE
jgi:hypothetical protein